MTGPDYEKQAFSISKVLISNKFYIAFKNHFM